MGQKHLEFKMPTQFELTVWVVEEPTPRGEVYWDPQTTAQADDIARKILGHDCMVKEADRTKPRAYRSARPFGEWKALDGPQKSQDDD